MALRGAAASSTVIPAKAGIQYCRAIAAMCGPRSIALQYWVARSSRAMTAARGARDCASRSRSRFSNSHDESGYAFAISRRVAPELCEVPLEKNEGDGAPHGARWNFAASRLALRRQVANRASPCGAPAAAIMGPGTVLPGTGAMHSAPPIPAISRRSPVPRPANQQVAEPRSGPGRWPGASRVVLARHQRGTPRRPSGSCLPLGSEYLAGRPAARSVPLQKRPREAPLTDRTIGI
ncbi:hypothetical protein HNR60_002997 [Rhodopseudomonas rhenobacensis]|uniref:Uncharacterized protein n=1 Tax=Rhodopseudomonas rhenobacensis TaxID=87461 RepID=A0A7W7Z584_9BRAD|nr:hypothetical protein [Rhodopseudomonas rhenobacensis]